VLLETDAAVLAVGDETAGFTVGKPPALENASANQNIFVIIQSLVNVKNTERIFLEVSRGAFYYHYYY